MNTGLLKEPKGYEARTLSPRADRIARLLIIGVGLVCLLLLAWDHLGLGALVAPPAPSAPQQVASVGADRVTLTLTSGQLTANGANSVAVTIMDAGRPVTDAHVQAQLVMTGMPMQAPAVTATLGADGRYLAHPKFGMAGDWRLTFVISRLGQATHTVSFVVGVRWS